MKKLKLYLDTSVISHLFADDALEKMEDTNRLWDGLIKGKYGVCISPVMIVNAIHHYKEISIMSPTMLVEGVD